MGGYFKILPAWDFKINEIVKTFLNIIWTETWFLSGFFFALSQLEGKVRVYPGIMMYHVFVWFITFDVCMIYVSILYFQCQCQRWASVGRTWWTIPCPSPIWIHRRRRHNSDAHQQWKGKMLPTKGIIKRRGLRNSRCTLWYRCDSEHVCGKKGDPVSLPIVTCRSKTVGNKKLWQTEIEIHMTKPFFKGLKGMMVKLDETREQSCFLPLIGRSNLYF